VIASLGALAGCGLGARAAPTGVKLTVTEDFGHRSLLDLAPPTPDPNTTVLTLLARSASVRTRAGGAVQSIDRRPGDWELYLNGVGRSQAIAASTRVRDGDRIWWDRHEHAAASRIPAVVGSFPEPFLHGWSGKRLPVRVECVHPRSAACEAAAERLTHAGVVAARGGLHTSLTEFTLRVLVGPWAAVRSDVAAVRLERGPRVSGVYARPSPNGRSIDLLDAGGRVTQTLGAGTGLVAATRVPGEQPVWLVTGTDERGTLQAARALGEDALIGRFALAIRDDIGIALPATRTAANR
jgi:hypothetical protein